MRQFFLSLPGEDPPIPGSVVDLDDEESHHLRTVLRGGREKTLILTDGRGRRYTARAVIGAGRTASVEILTCDADPVELASPRLALAVAVVKGRRFEWALEKATEIGAHLIIPLHCERGVIEPGAGKQQRWLGILRSAVKQSSRTFLPELVPLQTPAEALAAGLGPIWYGSSFGDGPDHTGRALESSATPAGWLDPLVQWLTVFIGPEGGWSADELARFTDCGAVGLGLGPHVLRTETAAVAALVVLQQWRARLVQDRSDDRQDP